MGGDLAETVKMLPRTMDSRGLCITQQRCVRQGRVAGKRWWMYPEGDLWLVEMGNTWSEPRLDSDWKRLSCSHSLQLLEYPCHPENVRH